MLTDKSQPYSSLKIWGGIECTINRVGDTYYDQLKYAGHYNRPDDIEKIASLKISRLRYPVLWEHHEKFPGQVIDWSWTSGQLEKIKSHGIEPIVTLLHHGSGPAFTNLLDENFPELLAAYAGKVAQQFPWVKFYTPVNEPLTTARFSGLYGFWYPHKSNDISFVKMLLNQLKAVVLCMREIRKYNPQAQLIQTEDLGKTYSKPSLEYQAIFENNRRWLTYDLLTGKVDGNHPMWHYFVRLGIKESDISFFRDNPCVPDIMGVNYYVTSERFLDDEIDKYEKHTHGSNELQTYADIEAIRVPHELTTGLKHLLHEAWERYGLELAITECHINCSREEQLRWLNEMWEDCKSLNDQGIPIIGLTVWSLLGAYGWNKLLLTDEKDYEVGAFDVRSGEMRITAVGELVKDLAGKNISLHPVTEVPGWWKRNIRFLNNFQIKDIPLKNLNVKPHSPILIIGKTGTLGRAFTKACNFRKINFLTVGRDVLDITKPFDINSAIKNYQPWAIINAAGYVKIDEAEADKDKCYKENTVGVANLANACKLAGIQLMTFSSDQVFDGKEGVPYVEDTIPNPINTYGESKLEAEKAALVYDRSLIIRTSTFFSPFDKYNFVYDLINKVSEGRDYNAPVDIFTSPTYVPDLVNAALDLLIDKASGIWHLSCGEEWSWFNLARYIAKTAGANTNLVHGVPSDMMGFIAARPKYAVLKTSKGIYLPGFEDGLRRLLNEDRLVKAKLANQLR